MGVTLEEWLRAAEQQQHPCFAKWADRLLEMGASWDSFDKRHHDPDQLVQDLVAAGIPILAARDMVHLASTAVHRSPVAIFWDLENVPIPTNASGRDVAARLKSILAPHGDLAQFRGYASIASSKIPQQKRSDLQLSGCHLVDCPHNRRKEVADKMILVDAMQFAYTHIRAATLCFITEDVDYAYLLAVLQRLQCRTIVISKGTIQSMLHVNCDMQLQWETDILLQHRPHQTAPTGLVVSDHSRTQEPASADGQKSAPMNGNRSLKRNRDAVAAPGASTTPDKDSSMTATPQSIEQRTVDKEWAADAELLRTVLKKVGGRSALKSLVGTTLRHDNPARFPHREAVQNFLAQAIASGLVLETGKKGERRMLSLPTDDDEGQPAAVGLLWWIFCGSMVAGCFAAMSSLKA